jgi:lipopolysaccharide biosynthesis protein
LIHRWQGELAQLDQIRLIAFYLPQFHPIPENDLWWGKGFTEWSNVAKAQPNFSGHYQPHLPADLGYYDLRVSQVLDSQIDLARRYGLFGFCFYYYWFAGKRLLEGPLELMLSRENSGFPYCICWANENWTRRWDGMDSEILMSQAHSADDDRAVIVDMIRYLRSKHYIRVNGRPLILVYRVDQFPNFRKTADIWRRACSELGVGDIYIGMVESFTQAGKTVAPREYGCDACVEFPPHNFGDPRRPPSPVYNPNFDGHVHDYQQMVSRYVARPGVPFKRFRGVMPSWDNTPRRQNSSETFVNSSPGAFQAWLEVVVEETKARLHGEERIVFVNAWNEWAEGAYLEPDRVYGHAWLEAIKNALDATWVAKT